MQFCNKAEMVKYGVVIVTYNRKKLLNECIECVAKQTKKFNKVLIIDNCSTDGTKNFLDEYAQRNSEVEVYHTTENFGGAGGFKLGVEMLYLKVDYVLLIDDDAMLNTKFLEEIDNNLQEKIGAYSGTVTTEGKIDTTHRRVISNSIFMTKKDVSLSKYEKEYYDYDLATFCGLMINTDIIKKIGFPKSEYFIWYDDTEYSLRVGQFTKIRNINKAVIDHKAISSFTNRLSWKSYYGYRNAIDVGRIYSKNKILFLCYRYLFHSLRFCQYWGKMILSKSQEERKYNSACAFMNIDVLVDSFHHRLGKCDKYYPGMRM